MSLINKNNKYFLHLTVEKNDALPKVTKKVDFQNNI